MIINLICFRTQTKYQMAKRTTSSQARIQLCDTVCYRAKSLTVLDKLHATDIDHKWGNYFV